MKTIITSHPFNKHMSLDEILELPTFYDFKSVFSDQGVMIKCILDNCNNIHSDSYPVCLDHLLILEFESKLIIASFFIQKENFKNLYNDILTGKFKLPEQLDKEEELNRIQETIAMFNEHIFINLKNAINRLNCVQN